MATLTLGTNATNTLTALVMAGSLNATDMATIANSIKDDQNVSKPVMPGCFVQGMLFVPNRGVLRVLPGDYVGVDARGWPILVSGDAITGASTSWTHS